MQSESEEEDVDLFLWVRSSFCPLLGRGFSNLCLFLSARLFKLLCIPYTHAAHFPYYPKTPDLVMDLPSLS